MPTTADHARLIIRELTRLRRSDGTIPKVDAASLIHACGFEASTHGVAYGQAVSLLDAACILTDLPWLARLIIFKKKRTDLTGPWAHWQPHIIGLLDAPALKVWSKQEMERIASALPTIGPAKWWRQHELQSKALLERALIAARSQPCMDP